MNQKLISNGSRQLASHQNIKMFLGQFDYVLINDALSTIRNLIYIMLDTDKYPVMDRQLFKKPNKLPTERGLKLSLSKDYAGYLRKMIFPKGFISTKILLNYYEQFYKIFHNKIIKTENNCYELCYLLKDFIEFTKQEYNLNKIDYQLIYTSSKHSLLRLKIGERYYDFDPDKKHCYFGPARLEINTPELTVESHEFEKFFDFFQAQILFFENSYQEAKTTLRSLFPLRIIERLLVRIDRILEESTDDIEEEEL